MTASLLAALLASTMIEASTTATEVDRLSGAYRWESGGFLEVLPWEELGPGRLVAFDDQGWIRALTPAGPLVFTAGRSVAVLEPVGARVTFEAADATSPARTLVWEADGQPPRLARRVEDHRAEEVAFANGTTRLAGTLLLPPTGGPHPALVLLHGSGPQNRYGTLPFARFLVRHGVAILAFDKRGVGGSQGNWRKTSFETLADDALAAVDLLRSRRDIDRKRIGLFGVSQGGWIGPLAASRSRKVALVVSVSGPGVTPAEQTLDLIEAELRTEGVPEEEIREALDLTRLAFRYSRTGAGWEDYAGALARSQGRSWLPYLPLPPDALNEAWEQQRLFFHYDPAPALAALHCPVLALFGAMDSGIPVEKNRGRWQEALTRGGHRDHALIAIPAANHLMWEAKTGSMYEIPGLDRFVPEYRKILLDWLRPRLRLSKPTLVFRNVNVIDVGAGRVLPGMNVVIATDRIESVGKGSVPGAATVIDASGQFLMPGLWDMHVHLTDATEIALPALVANGITGVRDMGGDLAVIDRWMAEIAAGTRIGPRIVRPGPSVDGVKPDAPHRLEIQSGDEARRAVDSLQAMRVDFIKLHTGVPREAYLALMEEAGRRGMPVAGHVPAAIEPREASAAGQKSLEHVATLFEGPFATRFDNHLALLEGIIEFAGSDAPALFETFSRNGTWLTPTLVTYQARITRGQADARERYIAPSLQAQWDRFSPVGEKDRDPAVIDARRRLLDAFTTLVGRMREAGVPLLAGTDLGARGVFPQSLHDELELLVRSGLSPAQALRAATSAPARFLGREAVSGAVAQGMPADFVHLDANPLEDIRHSRAIRGVVLNGRYLPKGELDGLLADVERAVTHGH